MNITVVKITGENEKKPISVISPQVIVQNQNKAEQCRAFPYSNLDPAVDRVA
jgi:hypothetical protein